MTEDEVRGEREAICLESGVPPERARLIAECEADAFRAQHEGRKRECGCGLHQWGDE